MCQRRIYCPFCDKENPLLDVIDRGTDVFMTRNMAPRQPCSNVLVPKMLDGQHYGSFTEMPEHVWLELLILHAKYIHDNPRQFQSGGKPTWRLVFNYTAPHARYPGGRQSVFHLHGQQFGPGPRGGSLGRFVTVPQRLQAAPSEEFRHSLDAQCTGEWSWRRDNPASVAPLDILILPPRNYPGILDGGPTRLLDLQVILRGLVATYPALFRQGSRLVFNAGEDALQLSRQSAFEVRLVGGTGLDLGQYTEHSGSQTLPDPSLMAAGDARLSARAAELGQEHINWWVHTTGGASA